MTHDGEKTLTSHPGSASAAFKDERRMSLLIYHRNGVDVVPLVSNRPITIGRMSPADIIITDDSLSRKHAVVELVDDEVWITDLKSTNGTRINGKKIDRASMKIVDELMLGFVSVSLHVMTPMDGQLYGLDSNDRFHTLLEEEITRAKTFGRKLALIMVSAARRPRRRLSTWCPRIRQLLRPVDRIGLYSPDVVEILLPESDLQHASQLAQKIVSEKKPTEPQLFCGAAVFPDAGSSAEELIEVAQTALKRTRIKEPVHVVGISDPSSTASFEIAVQGDTSAPIFRSSAMKELSNMVDRLAPSSVPVLILGETGVGKEVIARAIHERSGRSDKPMRCINCGAIPEQLIESVLFGHERGAFTGADRRSQGVFEEADGGVVFLDEIGELSLHAQVSLLRVLDTKRFTRVGSNQEIGVDVRIIAATNQDLHEMCEVGTFRSDLFFRLSTMVLKIPPLRERREEIQPLAEHFSQRACEADGREVKTFAPQAMSLLWEYHWPGNVRELRNVIERAVLITRSDEITEDDLPERLQLHPLQPQPAPSPAPLEYFTEVNTSVTSIEELEQEEQRQQDDQPSMEVSEEEQDSSFKARLQRFEIALIRDAMHRAGGSQTKAARLLGIARRTLFNKIDTYGIDTRVSKRPSTMEIPIEMLLDDDSDESASDLKSRLERYEIKLLLKALEESGGDKTAAAQLLGIPKYMLANKVTKYGLK